MSISRCSFVISINSYLAHYANYVTQIHANNMKTGMGGGGGGILSCLYSIGQLSN